MDKQLIEEIMDVFCEIWGRIDQVSAKGEAEEGSHCTAAATLTVLYFQKKMFKGSQHETL